MTKNRIDKPLGHRAYGSIGHLPGSRTGPSDKGVNEGQARIATEKSRDKHDTVIVQEKLDGSCVSVAKIDGEIVPLIRAGYRAEGSHYRMHHLFAHWVYDRYDRFASLLKEGERVCGEWLLQAHGTRYEIWDEDALFAVFDLMTGQDRETWNCLEDRVGDAGLYVVPLLHAGEPLNVEGAIDMLGNGHYQSIDPPEGAVWRVERHGKVDFLAKFVKPDKVDGLYLPGCERSVSDVPVWNFPPNER